MTGKIQIYTKGSRCTSGVAVVIKTFWFWNDLELPKIDLTKEQEGRDVGDMK